MYTSLGTFLLLLLNVTNSFSQMLCYIGLAVIEHQSNVCKVKNFTSVHNCMRGFSSFFTGFIFITNMVKGFSDIQGG